MRVLKPINYHKMVKKGRGCALMKPNWKYKVAKMTGANRGIDKKIFQLKSSWDEVSNMLNSSVKKKKR